MELIDGNNGLWGLFFSALISSTLLPGGSEILLGYLVNQGEHSHWLLLGVATLGNTLGALITLLMGILIATGLIKKKAFTDKQLRGMDKLKKWGSPLLLLSWLPVVGDALCLAAGMIRTPLLMAMLFITIGKGLRYYAVILISG